MAMYEGWVKVRDTEKVLHVYFDGEPSIDKNTEFIEFLKTPDEFKKTLVSVDDILYFDYFPYQEENKK